MKKVVGPILASLLVAFGLFLIYANFSSIYGNLPKPKSDRGEFPFKIVFETENDRVVAENILIIEFQGQIIGEEKYNKWKYFFKEENNKVFLREDRAVFYQGFDEQGIPFSLSMRLGSCEYYMGLEETGTSAYRLTLMKPGDIVIEQRGVTKTMDEKELYQRYKINIIEKILAKPLG